MGIRHRWRRTAYLGCLNADFEPSLKVQQPPLGFMSLFRPDFSITGSVWIRSDKVLVTPSAMAQAARNKLKLFQPGLAIANRPIPLKL